MKNRFANLAALALTLGLFTGAANASLIFHEPFDYTPLPTPINAKSGWTNHSGTIDQLQVVAGSLSYAGLEASTGGKIEHLQAQSEDVGRDFAAVTGNGSTVYLSALVECVLAPGTGGGDYFLHLWAGDSAVANAFRARLWAQGSGAGFTFALMPTSGTPTAGDFNATEFALNQVHLVVIKVTISDGADTFELFVNPNPADPEPSTALISVSADEIVPAVGVGRVAIRQGGNFSGSFNIDELRVGTTWEAVTPTVSSLTAAGSDWTLYN